MSHMRFGRPRVRWFSREGCLSAEESIAEGGMPGVGGVMNAELFAARLCNRGEGSDFCGGQRSTGGMLGDEEVEEADMLGQQPTVERPCPRRSSPKSLLPPERLFPAALDQHQHLHLATAIGDNW
jgi:hypothetical protein